MSDSNPHPYAPLAARIREMEAVNEKMVAAPCGEEPWELAEPYWPAEENDFPFNPEFQGDRDWMFGHLRAAADLAKLLPEGPE